MQTILFNNFPFSLEMNAKKLTTTEACFMLKS